MLSNILNKGFMDINLEFCKQTLLEAAEFSVKGALAAGITGKLLAGVKVFSVVLVPANVTFISCAASCALSLALFALTTDVALYFLKQTHFKEGLAFVPGTLGAFLGMKVATWLTGLTFGTAIRLCLFGAAGATAFHVSASVLQILGLLFMGLGFMGTRFFQVANPFIPFNKNYWEKELGLQWEMIKGHYALFVKQKGEIEKKSHFQIKLDGYKLRLTTIAAKI